jgi:hypothetical protein
MAHLRYCGLRYFLVEEQDLETALERVGVLGERQHERERRIEQRQRPITFIPARGADGRGTSAMTASRQQGADKNRVATL